MKAGAHSRADARDSPSAVMPLVPGRNCWHVARSLRTRCIQDAADYFALARDAILGAERTVFILGWDILANLDSLPRIPVTPETFTIAGILTALVAAVVALIGAILGGMLGMRYHRRVDRVGLEGLSQR